MNELVFILMFGWSAVDAFQSSEFRADQPQQPLASTAVADGTTTQANSREAEAKKHIIVFFTANWCPSCVRMKSQTLPNVSLPGHDLRVVDVDANPGLVQSYGVQSIPAYFVLDGLGRAYRQGVGFRDVAQFIDFLNGR